ncbi:hypothetical protein B0H67DRAFT_265770 [Lasiosphaeris hirsuta]|uniref:Uncharacterized protein n=1 Tax=Lasiosphaeris hirsuta TaxID=260670 RepID=A0AA40A7U1_9PEZI|nr:hypothetical protein B0H67DRAFT_265770 [Lasiosphaeris hirsuta]
MTAEVVKIVPWTAAGKSIVVDHESRAVRIQGEIAPEKTNHADTAEAFSAALQAVVDPIIVSNGFSITHGDHSEYYRILGSQHGGVHPRVERYPAPLFGISLRGAPSAPY